jgi:thiol:disulfide interchange protein DsbC
MKTIDRPMTHSMKRPSFAAAWVLLVVLHLPVSSVHAMPATPSDPETQLLTALQKAHPGTRFTAVSRTPVAHLYEVWMGSSAAFVSDRNLRYLVFGHMFDTRDMTDLTAPKVARAQRLQTQRQDQSQTQDSATPMVAFEQLPLADAIKTVHGNGGDASRSLAVFSDPACPYCKRLEPELEKLNDVTIYTFLMPFQGAALPAAIWCATDRQKAWRQTMLEGERNALVLPATASSTACAHPLERNLALAQRLKVLGTPTILYANGRRTEGYADAAEIESLIKANASLDSQAASTAAKPLSPAHAPHTQEDMP